MGLDDICTEQLKNFEHAAREWLLQFFNECTKVMRIIKVWHKTHIIVVLKPGKLPTEVKKLQTNSILMPHLQIIRITHIEHNRARNR